MIAKTKATNDLFILVFWRFRQFISYLIDTDIEKTNITSESAIN